MKTLRKLLLTFPLLVATLTGCQVKQAVEESTESIISEVVSEEESASEESISEESTEPEVISEESSEEEISEESSEPAELHTLEGVIGDICMAMFGEAALDTTYWSDGQGGFYTGVGFGEFGEEYLALAVTTVAGKLPEYCVEVEAVHAGTWSDGENGAFASYAVDEGAISVEIGSYISGGKLYAQVNVF